MDMAGKKKKKRKKELGPWSLSRPVPPSAHPGTCSQTGGPAPRPQGPGWPSGPVPVPVPAPSSRLGGHTGDLACCQFSSQTPPHPPLFPPRGPCLTMPQPREARSHFCHIIRGPPETEVPALWAAVCKGKFDRAVLLPSRCSRSETAGVSSTHAHPRPQLVPPLPSPAETAGAPWKAMSPAELLGSVPVFCLLPSSCLLEASQPSTCLHCLSP